MKRYRVTLPIDVGGTIYHPGAAVDLDAETAAAYAHALEPVKEETNARNS
jgi:hypothetical protein